ncbi:MAG: helix-hairpin-helix domain-containing protein [Saprospiraceae bacterium]
MQFDIIFLDTLWGLPCWLLWLLASLLSGFLGYMIGRAQYKPCCDRVAEAEAEAKKLHAGITDWEAKYRELQYKFDELDKSNTSLRASLNHCEADKAALSAKLSRAEEASKNVAAVPLGFAGGSGGGTKDYVALVGQDNLQIIEGIGPKIEQLLKNAGYTSWTALAVADYDDLKKVLDEAGPRYRIHDPKSWPEQAKLAAEGKWDELIHYQKFLDAGRENTGDFESDSKLEKLIAKKLGYSSDPNDLKIVEGIGPKIEGLLHDAGIKTWADLAATSVDRLKEILGDAGERYRLADPTTWPKQAELAAAGKWDELKEYQDFLNGGKDPA